MSLLVVHKLKNFQIGGSLKIEENYNSLVESVANIITGVFIAVAGQLFNEAAENIAE